MRIKKLLLKNFRNYGEEVFGFDEGLNVLYGKNAQGKTNCAEAVFYLCTGASPRAKKDKQLIKSGEESAYIRAEAEGRYGSVTIEANIYENKREVRVNGVKISKNADLLGNINSVFFSPGELRLIQDGPEERRRFLNVSNSQMSRSYYTALIRYNKILEQRNALLKNRDIELIYETLPVWDAQLAHYAAELVDKRKEYLEMLAPLAQEKHAYLTDNAEKRDGNGAGAVCGIFLQLRARHTVGIYRVGTAPRRYQGADRRGGSARVRLAGADAHGGARGETCGSGNFQTDFGRVSRIDLRRRDERTRPVPPQKTDRQDRRDPDHSHLHAHGKGALRKRMQQNTHREREDYFKFTEIKTLSENGER